MGRRFVLILSTILFLSFGLSFSKLFGETATSELTTSQSTEQTSISSLYSYSNKDDLVNQLYNDLYPEIRNEIYSNLIDSIQNELNKDIYESIQSKFNQLLNQQVLSVPLDDLQAKITEVSNLSDQSVLGVTSYNGTLGVSLGSSVIYDYDETTQTYYVITNEHVIDDADNYQVVFSDRSSVVATLLGYDKDVDIAVLSFSGVGLSQSLKVSPLGESSSLAKASIILAAGNPKGFDFYNTLTLGIVAGVNRTTKWDDLVPYIQHDAAINSGNSGGPIYNLEGEVVGINVAKFASDEIEGMGFAIPIDMVKNVINTIRVLGGSFTDTAGSVNLNQVSVDPKEFGISSPLAEVKLTLPNQVTTGLMINRLNDNGILSNSGVAVGDLIIMIDDYSISTLYLTHEYIDENYQSGNSITLWYYSLNKLTLSYSNTLKSVTITL